MAHSTVTAFDIVRQLDRGGKLNEAPNSRKQKIATGLLRDCVYSQDFAGPISVRASKILGPISRYRVADILHHMKLASNASRPGLAVGMLRVLCNGMCTAQRFHNDEEEHTCHVGCPDRPDSLSPYNECPLLYELLSSLRRQADSQPRRSHLLLDLISQVFLRSLQFGITVTGLIDAFVYARSYHRRNFENPGSVGDNMKGRIRFMTAITPVYANAYQATCPTRHLLALPCQNFRLTKPKARYPHLPNVRSATRERGSDFKGWAIYTDG